MPIFEKKKKSFRRIKGLFFSSCLLSQDMKKKDLVRLFKANAKTHSTREEKK